MPWQDKLIVISLLASIIISASLMVWGWLRRATLGAMWFSALMFMASYWSLFYGLEMTSESLAATILWSKVQYFGSTNLAVLWLLLVLTYTGRKDWLNRQRIAFFLIIPAITLALAWTNEHHTLLWINPVVKETSSFYLLDFTPGIWWWVNIAYASGIFIIATILLLSSLFRSANLYRRQIIILLIFSSLTWGANLAYIFQLTQGIDLTPVTFSIGGILIAWGLFRYKIIDVVPIARDAIVETMRGGLIVLDTKKRIVDINPVAQDILHQAQNALVGEDIGKALAIYPQLNILWENPNDEDKHIDVTLDMLEGEERSFDVHLSPLRDKRDKLTGWLIFWHDITQRKEQELATRLISDIVYQISTASDFRSSLHKALQLVVEYAGWVLGEAWLPNREGTFLENSHNSYYIKTDNDFLKEFDQVSQEFTFEENVGLPGRVWVSRKMEWQTNISTLSEKKYLRSQYANNANLKAALGIPVLDEDSVIAVLVFYMDKARQEDQNMIALISTAAAQLGTVLKNKRAEEVMRIQSAALETTTSGIVITNRKGEIVWANPAFSILSGYSMEEIMGENPRVLKSGQHPPAFYRHLWEKISSGETWQGEIVNQRKDKSLYTEEQSITPTHNKDGEITHYIAIKKDISQRKEFEKKIQEQNTFLSSIIESVANPFYVINTQDYSIEIANSAARTLGIEQMKTCYALTHKRETPCDGVEHPCPLKTVLETKEATSVEHTHLDAEGNPRIMEVHGYPILNEIGEVTQMIEYSLDITARKEAEKEVRKLSRAVEQSGSTIVITDLEGNIEFTNPAFSEITGYTSKEVLGQNTNILSSGKHPSSFYQELWEIISSGNVWQGEMVNRKKNGELYWEAAMISPVQNETGETTHFLAVKEDISERKIIEKALAQEQEKTDALLRNILPEKVAREIKETGKAKPVLFENTSILFTDFSNFTATAETLSPDELVKLIDYYFTAFDKITEKYHLEKLKTIGDSYMCASGLPSPNPKHAINITIAAFDMLEFVRQAKEERQQKELPFWDIRVGISSGSVVAGVVGQKKYAYDIWGDAVVMAARMEQSGEIDKVNISETTYELIKEDFNCQYRGEIAAKHKGQVKMYFVDKEKRD